MLILLRALVVASSIYFWHLTQSMLARRTPVPHSTTRVSSIHDEVHSLTSTMHAKLAAATQLANFLLASSSAIVDVLGLFLFTISVFGSTFEPVVGIILLFTLRQFAQSFCHLQPPQGIIWRNPGVPSLFVTYDVKDDLFFSGHTAFAVYGALILHSILGDLVGLPVGFALVFFQISTVLLLRVHYTMDVFTGIFCALYIHQLSHKLSPSIDNFLFATGTM
ncbi:uncharacterized protein LY89DRAFT_718181 [Mollisia scopiformis]|uniref:AtPDCT1/2 transmembrane domain-containing protein n=1 Tax=Mollisia scopiformis TaxID=149040 RepID=A0A194XBF4_MOLSC|nr:uncharacterized protein LY89DRAFT_718181 [Mollisia scopiformis]KUJ17489.1 hypothetical protein LY89DRAFT_718181 [Mollisia scopiformis]